MYIFTKKHRWTGLIFLLLVFLMVSPALLLADEAPPGSPPGVLLPDPDDTDGWTLPSTRPNLKVPGSVTIGTTLSLGATNETAFTDGDTTPSVASDCNFVTANTGATSITRLDDVTQGELGIIRVNDANTTFDCTSSNIIGNGGVDYSAASGDLIFYYSYDGTNVVIGITKPIAGGGDSDAIHDNVAGEIAAVAGKATVVDADMILIEDSADSNSKKMVTLTNFWANYLKSKADALYEPVDATILKDADIGVNVQAYGANTDTDNTDDLTVDGAGEINGISEKESPVSADLLVIEDSADSNNKKKVQIGNLPTGSDSAAIHDNVASEISAITEKASPVSGDMLIIEDSADSNNKKMVQVGNLPSSAGDISGVLGDATGPVPLLFQDASAFTGSDATPDVSTALHWITADTTTYTDFDGTPVDGQQLWIYCKHAATFDLTSSGIEAYNRTTDLTATVGFVAVLIYEDDDDQWHFINAPDEQTTLDDSGEASLIGSAGSNNPTLYPISASIENESGNVPTTDLLYGHATNAGNHAGMRRFARLIIPDPDAYYQAGITEFPLIAETNAAITVTKIHVECDANPTTEPEIDIQHAATFIGRVPGSDAVVDVCDTTDGLFEATSSFDDADIASDRSVYVTLSSDPDDAIELIIVEVEYDFD